jgi:hypothetical protein
MGDSEILANGHAAHVGMAAIDDANIKPTINSLEGEESRIESTNVTVSSGLTTESSFSQEVASEVEDYDMLIIGAGISGM